MNERAHTDEGYEERILDARNAAAELSDEDDERVALAAVPERVPTPAQGATIGRLIVDFRPTEVSITYEPFDLPAGYVLVQLRPSGFTAGIAPDGRTSS